MEIKNLDCCTFGRKYPIIPPGEFASRVRQGMSYKAIGQELNVPRHVIEKSIQYYADEIFTQADLKFVVDLYRKGYTPERIKSCIKKYPLGCIKSLVKKLEAKEKVNSNNLIYLIVYNLNLDKSVLKNLK